MTAQTAAQVRDWLNILVQVLLIVLPVIVSWYLRVYVRNTTTQPKIAAIARLASAAIDYAENLDKRGDLPASPDISQGMQKLKIASDWLREELDKNGMSITNDQAQKWVASQFQSRVGSDASKVANTAQVAKAAVDMVQSLARSNVINIPPDIDRFSYLAGLAADWVVTQLAGQGMQVSRDEALTWVRSELFTTMQTGAAPNGDRLADLARQALGFVNDLKAKGQLAVRPGSNPQDTETDLATAWVMTEAAKQGIPINPDLIIQAVTAAMLNSSGSTMLASR
ncbi:MAG TPA: phage holin, LLH family [Anaerolineales bacterium]